MVVVHHALEELRPCREGVCTDITAVHELLHPCGSSTYRCHHVGDRTYPHEPVHAGVGEEFKSVHGIEHVPCHYPFSVDLFHGAGGVGPCSIAISHEAVGTSAIQGQQIHLRRVEVGFRFEACLDIVERFTTGTEVFDEVLILVVQTAEVISRRVLES